MGDLYARSLCEEPCKDPGATTSTRAIKKERKEWLNPRWKVGKKRLIQPPYSRWAIQPFLGQILAKQTNHETDVIASNLVKI